MLHITDYKEFFGDPKNSALNHLALGSPIPEKQVILRYLNNAPQQGICASSMYDIVEKHSTFKTRKFFDDGVYEWTNDEVYHFEKYNLELDPEFIQYVLKKAG